MHMHARARVCIHACVSTRICTQPTVYSPDAGRGGGGGGDPQRHERTPRRRRRGPGRPGPGGPVAAAPNRPPDRVRAVAGQAGQLFGDQDAGGL